MGTSAADLERFTLLYRQHYWPVLRYLVRRERDEELARDAAAEVFTVAWRRLHDVPDEALPWLYATSRNVLANARRARARRHRLFRRLAAEPADTAPGGTGGDDTELSGPVAVHTALAALSEPDREVLRLAAWEELTAAEMGVVLGCTANAASVRLHRARGRFRTAMDALEQSRTKEDSRHDR